MTILAVDDDPLVRALLATALRGNGFTVMVADSAAEAFSVFREHAKEIDLLITDIQMPGIDGPSLAAALQLKRPELKVLLISGYCSSEQLVSGFEFLAKPFAINGLLSKVGSMLDPQNRRSSLQTAGIPEGAVSVSGRR